MATFWTGSSVTFTNGQKTATVGTGDDISSIYPNSVAMVNGIPYEVAKAYTSGSPTIELEKNWPLASGTHAVTIFPSAAAAAKAGQTAQTLMTSVSTLVNSASATATANSFAKRDANGRLLVAAGSSGSHAVNFGQLGAGAFVESYKDYGVGTSSTPAFSLNGTNSGGVYNEVDAGRVNIVGSRGSNRCIALSAQANTTGTSLAKLTHYDSTTGSVFYDEELFHSGNANFDFWSGAGTDDIVAVGLAMNSTTCNFFFPIHGTTTPVSITTTGNFKVFNSAQSSIATGVSPSLVGGASGNKIAYLRVSGLSGLNAGSVYTLWTGTSDASIKVDF